MEDLKKSGLGVEVKPDGTRVDGEEGGGAGGGEGEGGGDANVFGDSTMLTGPAFVDAEEVVEETAKEAAPKSTKKGAGAKAKGGAGGGTGAEADAEESMGVEALQKLTVPQLKDLLRERQLPVGGTKVSCTRSCRCSSGLQSAAPSLELTHTLTLHPRSSAGCFDRAPCVLFDAGIGAGAGPRRVAQRRAGRLYYR